jgi:hypothetical protein
MSYWNHLIKTVTTVTPVTLAVTPLAKTKINFSVLAEPPKKEKWGIGCSLTTIIALNVEKVHQIRPC